MEGRGRSDCSGMSQKWPGPGQRRPPRRESGWWCGSWPATSREPRSIRHTQPLTDPRTICRGRLGRYVHAPPAVQWVQTQRRTRVGNCARVNKSEFPLWSISSTTGKLLPQHEPPSAGQKNRPMDLNKSLLLVIDEVLAQTEVWYSKDQGQPQNHRIYADYNS